MFSACIKTSTPGAGAAAIKFSAGSVFTGIGVGVDSAIISCGALTVEITVEPIAISAITPSVEAIIKDQLVPLLARKFSTGSKKLPLSCKELFCCSLTTEATSRISISGEINPGWSKGDSPDFDET